jgi:archaemetzincin
MPQIDLIFHLFKNPDLSAYLTENISTTLGIPTGIQDKKIEIELFFDKNRYQYNAAKIIQSIDKELASKTLIYTTVDIFIPIFTFVFGLAKFEGNAGIVSTHRLNNIYYGLPEDNKILQDRTLKESIHEFGHLMGLHHCLQFGCVMSSSTTAEDLDFKEHYFCPTCLTVFEEKKAELQL